MTTNTGYGDWNTGYFIGSVVNFLSGQLALDNTVFYSTAFNAIFTSAVTAQRRLYGDVKTEKSGIIT